METGAIILAGGQSRRMGTDKALLRLRPDGPRLIEMVLAVVEPLVSQLVVSTNRPADYSWLGKPLVSDRVAGQGPLGGLEAGLNSMPTSHCLLVACDMPFIKPAVLEYLLSKAEGYAAVVPLSRQGHPEPLCAVYSRACLPVIQSSLKANRLKMTDWLSDVPTCFVPPDELERLDPGLVSFKNLNSPQDVALTL